MTTNEIDAIEARMKDEVAENGDELEFIGIYFSAEEARGLCAEVRELRAALEQARVEIERLTVALHTYERANNTDLLSHTAPATGTSALINEIEAKYKCECGHWMVDHDRADDGRRVCMHPGCDCIKPAMAAKE